MGSKPKILLIISFWVAAYGVMGQDSLRLETLRPITYYFTIKDGQLSGEGKHFLKREIEEAQFTLLGDYVDSKGSSDFTSALLPELHDAAYKTIALGIGAPSARLLHRMAKEPSTLISKLKSLNNMYAFIENERHIMPMPDMKSVADAHFVQKAGALQWNIIGFGTESWNNLPWLLEQMYGQLSKDLRNRHLDLYQSCQAALGELYQNRKGNLSSFSKAIKHSKFLQDFIAIVHDASSENQYLTEAFHNSVKNCRMHADKRFFEKNKWRVSEEKRLLRQELERIGFNIHQDKLFVKWDMNFLSRGFQPYAFYGVGNTLSEIANYNGKTSLHIGMVPRYQEKDGVVVDLMKEKHTMANRLASLIQVAVKDSWTVIDLRKMIQESYYAPVKHLLSREVQDLIKRYDLVVIPAIEEESVLNYDGNTSK